MADNVFMRSPYADIAKNGLGGGGASARPLDVNVPQYEPDEFEEVGVVNLESDFEEVGKVDLPSDSAPEPEEVDPFEGESFGDLSKRRGQQFVQGAVDVVASVPEAMAIYRTKGDINIKKLAPDRVKQAQETVTNLTPLLEKGLSPLSGKPMSPEERGMYQQRLDEANLAIQNWNDLAEAEVTPADKRGTFKYGDEIRGAAGDVFGKPDERDKSFWAGVAQGGGNVVGYMAGGGAAALVGGGAGGLVAGAGMGAAQNSASMYKEAKSAGADEETALQAAELGGAIGTLEIVPIFRAFKLLPASFRGKITNNFARSFIKAGLSAGEEGVQEYASQVLNNAVAQGLYDPERGWTEGATEAALMGLVIGAVPGSLGGIREYRSGNREEEQQAAPAVPVEEVQPTAEVAPQEPVAPSGPIGRSMQKAMEAAVEQAPVVQPDIAQATESAPIAEPGRVNVTTPYGETSGTLEGYTEDGLARVLADDGNYYDFDPSEDGIAISPLGQEGESDVSVPVRDERMGSSEEAATDGGIEPDGSQLDQVLAESGELPDSAGMDGRSDVESGTDAGKPADAEPALALKSDGSPFATEKAARQAAQNRRLTDHVPVEVDGGWALSPKSEEAKQIDVAASEAATSPENNLPEPTDAQKKAGNYKLGHTTMQGLDVSIENPKGSVRSGTDEDGKAWESTMSSHYGYIKRSEGADGDHVDVFIGDNPDSQKVFVVDQVNPDGSFDEHKVMTGFDSEQQAVDAYKANYTKGWKVGPVSEISMDDFKSWLKDGDTSKPYSGEMKVKAPEPISTRKTGKSATVSTPAGRDVDVEYSLVEAGDLVTSNLDDGRVNPAYPKTLQPRDRTRAASQDQVQNIAGNLNPRLLGEGPSTTDGAPIVSSAGIVESGNGRTIAIKRAYDNGKAEGYRQFLKDQGYDVEGMSQPVLVRTRMSEMTDKELSDYTRESNERTTLEMSATEQAMADAENISSIIADFNGGDIAAAANRDFVRKFVRDVAGQSERGGLIDESGMLSQEGQRRIGAALIASAYGDPAIVSDVFESSDTDIKAIGGALLDVAGSWAKMRQESRDGMIADGLDITNNLIEAVNIIRRARSEGKKIADLVKTDDMFSGAVDPMTENFLRIFYRGDSYARARGRDKVANALRDYTDQAMKTQPGDGLFGERTTSEQIIGEVNEKLKSNETDNQTDLFAVGAKPDAERNGQAGEGGRRPEPKTESKPRPEAERERKPEPKVTESAKPAKKLEDSGAELFANKKQSKYLKASDLDGMNESEQVKMATKSRVWEKPNYEQLVDDGMHPLTAYAVKSIYDGIAAKPASTDEKSLRTYIDAISQIRDAVEKTVKSSEYLNGIEAGHQNLINAGEDRMAQSRAARDLAVAFGEIGDQVMNAVFPQNDSGRRFGSLNKEGNDKANLLGGNRLVKSLDIRVTDLHKAMKAIRDGWPAKREAWQVRFSIGQRDGKWIVRNKNSRRVLSEHDTEAQAIEAAREAAKTERQKAFKEPSVSLDHVERIGVDRRTGDVDADQLRETFGFRGVNFGNWMNAADRQQHTNMAYDAFYDLADILGVPAKAMSLDGILGIAFGAQGKGGAAAHFVPGFNEINITKTTGAGSLAHEWGHALDHYFGSRAGVGRRDKPFLSEFVGRKYMLKDSEVRPEVMAAFEEIVSKMEKVDVIRSPEEMEQMRQQRLESSIKDVSKYLNLMRQSIKAENNPEAVQQFDALAEKIQNGERGEYVKLGRTKNFVGSNVNALRDIITNLGRAPDAQQFIWLDSAVSGIEFAKDMDKFSEVHKPQITQSTKYKKSAASLDKGKKDYYDTKLEMFARAFESYALDKLADREARNDYLTADWKRGQTSITEYDTEASMRYPQGEERTAINEAFDALFDTVEARETEKGVELYSVTEGQSVPENKIGKGFADTKAMRDYFKGTEFGSVIEAAIDAGRIVLHDTTQTFPESIRNAQAVTMPDGKIHLAADMINDQNAMSVLLHEMFHGGVRPLIGGNEWVKLHNRLGSLYRQGRASKGAAGEFWKKAQRRIDHADRMGAEMTPNQRYEEFGAYAIEEYENAPKTIKKWVDDLIGQIKAWLIKRFGIQAGSVTPAQLRALSVMALRDGRLTQTSAAASVPETSYAAPTINIDGVDRPTTNSNGQPIAATKEALENFWNWFGDSKVVDADGKPLVVYHGTATQFDKFDPKTIGRSGSSEGYGFYFTDASSIARGYVREGGNLIEAYLSIQNPMPHNRKNFNINEVSSILDRLVSIEINMYPNEIESYQDSFLSNMIDTYSTDKKGAIDEAARMIVDGNDSAVDQIAEISNIYGDKITPLKSVRDSLGFDGIYVKDFQEGEGDVYLSWFPEQIKSVFNRGSFNPDDARISYSVNDAPRDDVRSGMKYYTEIWQDADGSPVYFEPSRSMNENLKAIPDEVFSDLQMKMYDAAEEYSTKMRVAVNDILKEYGFEIYDDKSSRQSESKYWEVDALGENGAGDNPITIRFSDHRDHYGGNDVRAFWGATPESIVKDISGELDFDYEVDAPMYSVQPPASVDPSLERGSVRRVADKLVSVMQDRFADLKSVQNKIKNVTEGQDAYLAEELYHGRVRKRLDVFDENFTKPLLEKIKESGLAVEEVEEWLHARHAEEANKVLAERRPNQQMIDDKIADAKSETSKLTDQIRAGEKRGDDVSKLKEKREEYRREAARWKNVEPYDGSEEQRNSLSGMSDDEAKAVLDKHSNNKSLSEIGRMVDDINNSRLMIMGYEELMTPQEVDSIRGSYKHYVPLHREEVEQRMPSRGQGFNVRGNEIKSRVGSIRKVENILPHLIAQYQTTLVRAEKARIHRALFRLAKENPDPDFWQIEKNTEKAVLGDNGIVRTQSDPRYKERDNVLTVKVKGEEYTLEFNPQNEYAMRIASAMKNLEQQKLGAPLQVMASINRLLSAVNTGWNPEFVISNAVRDIQTAIYNLGDTEAKNIAGKMIRDYPKAMVGIRNALRGDKSHEWAKHFEEFEREGGRTGWMEHMDSIDDKRKQLMKEFNALGDSKSAITRRQILKLTNFIKDYNDVVENAVRLSAFVNARKAGLSPAKAASLAKNLTVNFNRRGSAGTMLNAAYLFYNASIQGNARMLKAMASSRRTQKLVVATIAVAAVMDMVNRAIGGDDDDGVPYYDKVPEYIKDRNMVFMGSDGDYFTLPLPWGYNVFHIIGQSAGEAATKEGFKPLDAAARIGMGIADAFNPVGSGGSFLQMLSPTVLDPAVQISENKNWAGNPLMPEQRGFGPEKPDSQMFFNSAREMSKVVSEKINELTGGNRGKSGLIDISPETIDLWIDFLTGGLGRMVANTSDTAARAIEGKEIERKNIPFVRKLYGKTDNRYDQAEYYDHVAEIESFNAQLKEYKNEPDMMKVILRDNKELLPFTNRLKNVNKQLKQLRTIRDRARAEGDEVKEKQIEDKMAVIYRRFNKQYREAVSE